MARYPRREAPFLAPRVSQEGKKAASLFSRKAVYWEKEREFEIRALGCRLSLTECPVEKRRGGRCRLESPRKGRKGGKAIRYLPKGMWETEGGKDFRLSIDLDLERRSDYNEEDFHP